MAIAEDSNKVLAALPDNTLSLPTLEKICSLIRILSADTPIHVKGPGKNVAHFHPTRLRNSLDIVPTDTKGKTVFVSLHNKVNIPSGSQGIRIKRIIMLTFDDSNRLSTSEDAVRSIVCLATSFRETDRNFAEKVRRISVMQKLKNSPHFPTNYAFIQVEGSKGKKLRILQQRASLDLWDFHAKIAKLTSIPTDSKLLATLNLLHALSDLKTAGYIHRDVKLENILVYLARNNTLDNVQLTDLGLASHLDDEETLSNMAGSITCVAPEIILHLFFNGPIPTISDAADIWSLGLVINALCTGNYANLQYRTVELAKHSRSVKDAETALELCKKTTFTPAEFARLCSLRHILKIPEEIIDPAKLLEYIQTTVALADKNIKQAREAWQKELAALPKPPAKITSLQDLATKMFQANPKDRISYEDSIAAVKALQSSEAAKNAQSAQVCTIPPTPLVTAAD